MPIASGPQQGPHDFKMTTRIGRARRGDVVHALRDIKEAAGFHALVVLLASTHATGRIINRGLDECLDLAAGCRVMLPDGSNSCLNRSPLPEVSPQLSSLLKCVEGIV